MVTLSSSIFYKRTPFCSFRFLWPHTHTFHVQPLLSAWPLSRKSAGKKVEKDECEDATCTVKKREDSDDDSDAGGNDQDNVDDVDVRDVRYKLEKLQYI